MITRRSSLAVAALGTAALALTACGSSSTASSSSSGGGTTVTVVASTNVWGSVVQAVAGDDAKVTSIISDPSADPHSYEANTRTQLEISKADLVVENGGGYDDFVDTMLKASGSKATVLNAVDLSGKTAPAGGELNEHVWYDVETVRTVAAAAEKALAAKSPANASTFQTNLAAFDAKLDTIEATIAADKVGTTGKQVAITEPVPLYLLDALGAVNATPAKFSEAIEEESDVPVDVLQETLSLFSGHQVQALVYNEQTTGAQTEQVLNAAKTNGIAVVPVTETLPEGKDYTTWMTENVDAIAAALGA